MLAKHAAVFPFSGITLEALQKALQGRPFTPCEPRSASSSGFVPPIAGDCALTREVGQVALFAMRDDEKILPASVVDAELKRRLTEITTKEGRRVGRKETREIKAIVTEDLREKAFVRTTVTHAWIDFGADLVVVASSSETRIEHMLALLARQFENRPHMRRWATNHIPSASFTAWVQSAEAPTDFTIDDSALLTHPEGGKVRLTRQSVLALDVRPLLVTGRSCVELAVTLRDKVSFVITEHLRLKRLAHLGFVYQQDSSQGDLLEEELRDAEITLSAGAVREIFAAINSVLGGLRPRDTPQDADEAEGAAATSPEEGDDPLYPQAKQVVLSNMRASISLVQRHLRIGYNRAARLIEQMERDGLVSALNSSGQRFVVESQDAQGALV